MFRNEHLLQREGPGHKVKTIGLVFGPSGKHFKLLYSSIFFSRVNASKAGNIVHLVECLPSTHR